MLAALTNALRVVGKTLPDVAHRRVRGRRGRPRRSSGCCSPRAPATSSPATGTAPSTRGQPEPRPSSAVDRRPHQPGGAHGHASREVLAGADVFIGVSAPDILLTGDDIATMADRRDRLRPGQPRPRGRPGRGAASTPPSSAPGAATTPTRSTTCSPSPGSSAGCSTPAPTTSPTRCCSPRPTAIADVVTPDELNPTYIVPSVFDPAVAPAVAAAVRAVAEQQAAARNASTTAGPGSA